MYNPDLNPIFNGLWVHFFVLLSISNKVVHYYVWEYKANIYSERIDINAKYMKDLRNYVYSLVEKFIQNELKKRSEDDDKSYSMNATDPKVNDIECKINNNDSIDYNVNYNKTSLDDIKNLMNNPNLNKPSTDQETNKPVDTDVEIEEFMNKKEEYDNLFEDEEMTLEEYESVFKIMNYKISFLYDIDLAFEYNYTSKIETYRSENIFNIIADYLETYMVSKTNNIQIKFTSYLSHINIDKTMFKYLICHLVIYLHEHNPNFKVSIQIGHINSNLIIVIKVELIDNDINNKIYFHPFEILNKIIENLNTNVQYDTILVDSKNIQIKIHYQHDYSDRFIKFDPKHTNVIIGDDKHLLYHDSILIQKTGCKTSLSNSTYNPVAQFGGVQLYNHVYYKEYNGYVYINIDCNSKCRKLNEVIFEMNNICLISLQNSVDYSNLFPQIYMDYNLNKSNTIPTLVVFIDHAMENEYGYDIIKMSQRIQNQFDLEIIYILLSNHSNNTSITEQYKRLGVNQIIQKPLTIDILNDTLSNIINNKIYNIIRQQTIMY